MFKDGLCEMEVSQALLECKICWVILVWSYEDTVWHKPVSPNFGQTVVFRFHFRELDLLANSMFFQIGGDTRLWILDFSFGELLRFCLPIKFGILSVSLNCFDIVFLSVTSETFRYKVD